MGVINSFRFGGDSKYISSTDCGLYISRRIVKPGRRRTTENDYAYRNGARLEDDTALTNGEIVYECFVVDNAAENVRKLLAGLFRQDDAPSVERVVGYRILRDTYDADGYRLAYVKGQPEVEFMAHGTAATVKITFGVRPEVWLDAGDEEISLLVAGSLTIYTPGRERWKFDSYPTLKTKGHGTIEFTGYRVTIADETYFDNYWLTQDFDAVTISPESNTAIQGVTWTTTDYTPKRALPRLKASNTWAYTIKTTGTVYGTIKPRWWRL